MDWQEPGIILAARPYGEGGAIVTVMTESHGLHRGLARGGTSRSQVSLWQPGNLAELRWTGRLSDQLGTLSGEMVHPAAALAMDDPFALSLLSAATAMALEALPEREPHPAVFGALVSLIGHLAGGAEGVMADYCHFEALLLTTLGYGLDLTSCAATGAREGLIWVSPRTGRAVSAEAGAPYADRLLRLPVFMRDIGAPSDARDWAAAMALTGHFLSRDLFGAQHRGMPEARQRLADRVQAQIGEAQIGES
ncbi:DNA repair protein RecO [Acetobacteraceae bacterium H6797]|nr:DNA repair protein RecO [Acetobacteraceae bacterium H6797]